MENSIDLLSIVGHLGKYQTYLSGLTAKADSSSNNYRYSIASSGGALTGRSAVRKIDFKDSPPTGPAVTRYIAVVAFHNTIHNGQSKTGSLS